MACGCLGKASEAEVFKDSKERWCTDILFLILLIFSVRDDENHQCLNSPWSHNNERGTLDSE